ncbi:MAG: alanine racemase [Planctomycetes bacterium]|nr:alanine racemase [Planctomycetota bacterium]
MNPEPTERLLRILDADHRAALHLGGVPAAELAARFGTPCYVYDAAILRQRARLVARTLGVEVLFALKANPSLAVTAVLAGCGTGADVSSLGELLLARRAGVPPARIQFAGPGKTTEELTSAAEAGIAAIHVESAQELAALEQVGSRLGRRVSVGLRLRPGTLAGGAEPPRLRIGGADQKFGVSRSEAIDLARRVRESTNLQLVALHGYLGTQCFDARAWLGAADQLLDAADAVERAAGAELPMLNFGGGFAVGYFAGDGELDLTAVGAGLRERLSGRPQRRAVVELGRYLTAPAGVYLTRVRYTKHEDSRRVAILDGGMHHHAAAAGLGAVLRRPFPIVAAHSPRTTETVRHALCGPLCTPLDELAAEAELPELAPGDLLAVLGSGAYGMTFSHTMFSSHPTPAEVLVDGGQAFLIREPGCPTDAQRGQLLPAELAADAPRVDNPAP